MDRRKERREMLKDVIYSVVSNKCPQCHQTNVFETNNAFNFKRFDKMNESCSHCGVKYEKEPGYFQGAMYVSYGLTAGWFMITWALDTFLFQLEIWQYLTFFAASVVILMPIWFRISRLIWINMFIPFNENEIKTIKK